MTKTSGVYDVPLPNDATPKGPSGIDAQMMLTHEAGVVELTAFYKDYMAAHHWTFEPNYSVMDPASGVSKSLGYTTEQIWCRPTDPITTVAIIVGSGDKTDPGKNSGISIQDDPGESSCP